MTGMDSHAISQGSAFEQAARRWRHGLYLVMPIFVIIALYWSTAHALSVLWNDTDRMTYTHGWMIAAISIWLLFSAGKAFSRINFAPSLLGSLALFLLGCIWLLAVRMNVQVMQMILFPALCCATLWTLYGSRVARVCGFACGYLLFAVPVWDFINPPLQWGTVFAVRTMVRAFSIPAYFEENIIHLPSGAIVVEGGCSGLNFFVAGMAVVVLYGYVNQTKHRFRLWALGVALMLVDNWLRVFIILLAGHLSDMQHYLVRVEHLRFGWVMFAAMIGIFLVIAARMEQQDSGAADQKTLQPTSSFRRRHLVAALAALLVVPGWALAINMRDLPIVKIEPVTPPANWVSREGDGGWAPVFGNADAQLLLHLENAGRVVDFYHVALAEQRQDKKLSGYGNSMLGNLTISELVGQDIISEQLSTMEFVDSRGSRHLIWQGYYVADKWFHAPRSAQLWYGLQSLISRPVSGAVALHAKCLESCAAERALMAELLPSLPLVPSVSIGGAAAL